MYLFIAIVSVCYTYIIAHISQKKGGDMGHMNKLIITLSIFSFLFVVPGVSAQTSETTPAPEVEAEVTDSGLLPDSPFYFLDSLTESIRGVFVFGDDNKAIYALSRAEERVSETKALADKGKGDLAGETAEKAADANEKVQEHLAKAQAEGKDVTAIAERLAANSQRQQQVLAEVLERVPEQAKAAIQRAMEVSQRGLLKAQEMQNKQPGQPEATGIPEEVNERRPVVSPTGMQRRPEGVGNPGSRVNPTGSQYQASTPPTVEGNSQAQGGRPANTPAGR